MKASPSGWIKDSAYPAELLTLIEATLKRKVQPMELGIKANTLTKIRRRRVVLKFPVQLLLESFVQPDHVKQLRQHYLSKKRPFWLTFTKEN